MANDDITQKLIGSIDPEDRRSSINENLSRHSSFLNACTGLIDIAVGVGTGAVGMYFLSHAQPMMDAPFQLELVGEKICAYGTGAVAATFLYVGMVMGGVGIRDIRERNIPKCEYWP